MRRPRAEEPEEPIEPVEGVGGVGGELEELGEGEGEGDWIIDSQKRTVRHRSSRQSNSVRVRQLSSGSTPCIGITIPSKILHTSGLEIGDRVYVLIEQSGRLVIQKISKDQPKRQRDRAVLLAILPADQRDLKEELMERLRTLEMDMADSQRSGSKKLARMKAGRADRVRWLIRKIGGTNQ